jgi:hypothetical protein
VTDVVAVCPVLKMAVEGFGLVVAWVLVIGWWVRRAKLARDEKGRAKLHEEKLI